MNNNPAMGPNNRHANRDAIVQAVRAMMQLIGQCRLILSSRYMERQSRIGLTVQADALTHVIRR
jgi:hypothetical protein